MLKLYRYNFYDPMTDIVVAPGDASLPVEVLALAAPSIDYTQVVSCTTINAEKSALYSKYRYDGQAYYDGVRAQYIIDIQTEVLTYADATSIDVHIREVTTEIESGSWHTAWDLVNLLSPTATFTQMKLDALILDIKTYINNNYPEELHVV